ncbi:MAG: hypothetical protein IT371_22655 [Deltaproteobacteria bacterium]|nr:hypothetical protein [Deltaproteobacteria bacterium]
MTSRERQHTPLRLYVGTKNPDDAEALRFGDWLVRRELISRRELYRALQASYLSGRRVGDTLVELGVLGRDCVEQEARAFAAFTAFTISG